MKIEHQTRVTNTRASLLRLLDDIDSGRRERPDWIRLQGRCRLDAFPIQEREALVRRLHGCVKRGFKADNVRIATRRKRLEYWCSIARNGFHDFTDLGWMKSYDSPFIESYDYITPYLEGGLDALDDYLLYTSVLGTLEYGVEDMLHTQLCEKVETLVEPMGGTADFVYHGHFRYPGYRYIVFDLDEQAKRHVAERRWLPEAHYEYFIGDVLDEGSWKKVRELSTGQSLAYIGKQSHHYFAAKDLLRLIDLGTRYCDYFVLEVLEPTLMTDISEDEDLTRPEMKDAGFAVALVNKEGTVPSPLTNRLSFDLEVSDRTGSRVLFEYHDWTYWQHPMLVALAELLDLNAYYYGGEDLEFISAHDAVEESDCLESVTFMAFTRHDRGPTPKLRS